MAAAETMPAYSRGSILGVLMHLAGAARTSAMGVAGIGVQMGCMALVLFSIVFSLAGAGMRAGAYFHRSILSPGVSVVMELDAH